MKVAHVITDLQVGGAQTMVVKLASRMVASGHECSVISLTAGGPLAERLERIGIPTVALGMTKRATDLRKLRELSERLRTFDVVQSWMYHADLAVGLACLRGPRPPLVWGIRQSYLNRRTTKPTTMAVAKLSALLSGRIPDRIVCCSEEAKRQHARWGYDLSKMVVIPNGFEIDRFRPDPEARAVFRKGLGVDEGAVLIGQIARFAPQKDHASFLDAAQLFSTSHPEVELVLCGQGMEWSNAALKDMIYARDLQGRTHLLGELSDVAPVFAGIDIATSSSSEEGFPNAIGEAMASGTPCVVTDVGDCAFLVGPNGLVVPPRQPELMADGWSRVLGMSSDELSRLTVAARQRIADHFSIDRVSSMYESLYREVRTSCAA